MHGIKISIISIVCIFSIFSFNLHGKVLIFTYSYNRPEFIEMQFKSFKKFLKDDFEFVVFNDAVEEELCKKIEKVCNTYAIQCIRIPQEIHSRPYLERPASGFHSGYNYPSTRNSNVVQYSLDILGFNHNDILLLLDSDIFLVQKFSIREYLKNYDLAGCKVPCYSTYPPHNCLKDHPTIKPFHYLWIGFVAMNMRTMPNKKTINFNCGVVFDNIRIDAGGYTCYYLANNKNAKVKNVNRNRLSSLICKTCKRNIFSKKYITCKHNTQILKQEKFQNHVIKFAQTHPVAQARWDRCPEFLIDGAFVHYRSGSRDSFLPNWYVTLKNQVFLKLMHNCLIKD